MKAFRHEKGHIACLTMTVAEVREKLSMYPDDMPMFAQWEGIRVSIDPINFTVNSTCKGMEEDRCDCLVVDVNDF